CRANHHGALEASRLAPVLTFCCLFGVRFDLLDHPVDTRLANKRRILPGLKPDRPAPGPPPNAPLRGIAVSTGGAIARVQAAPLQFVMRGRAVVEKSLAHRRHSDCDSPALCCSLVRPREARSLGQHGDGGRAGHRLTVNASSWPPPSSHDCSALASSFVVVVDFAEVAPVLANGHRWRSAPVDLDDQRVVAITGRASSVRSSDALSRSARLGSWRWPSRSSSPNARLATSADGRQLARTSCILPAAAPIAAFDAAASAVSAATAAFFSASCRLGQRSEGARLKDDSTSTRWLRRHWFRTWQLLACNIISFRCCCCCSCCSAQDTTAPGGKEGYGSGLSSPKNLASCWHKSPEMDRPHERCSMASKSKARFHLRQSQPADSARLCANRCRCQGQNIFHQSANVDATQKIADSTGLQRARSLLLAGCPSSIIDFRSSRSTAQPHHSSAVSPKAALNKNLPDCPSLLVDFLPVQVRTCQLDMRAAFDTCQPISSRPRVPVDILVWPLNLRAALSNLTKTRAPPPEGELWPAALSAAQAGSPAKRACVVVHEGRERRRAPSNKKQAKAKSSKTARSAVPPVCFFPPLRCLLFAAAPSGGGSGFASSASSSLRTTWNGQTWRVKRFQQGRRRKRDGVKSATFKPGRVEAQVSPEPALTRNRCFACPARKATAASGQPWRLARAARIFPGDLRTVQRPHSASGGARRRPPPHIEPLGRRSSKTSEASSPPSAGLSFTQIFGQAKLTRSAACWRPGRSDVVMANGGRGSRCATAAGTAVFIRQESCAVALLISPLELFRRSLPWPAAVFTPRPVPAELRDRIRADAAAAASPACLVSPEMPSSDGSGRPRLPAGRRLGRHHFRPAYLACCRSSGPSTPSACFLGLTATAGPLPPASVLAACDADPLAEPGPTAGQLACRPLQLAFNKTEALLQLLDSEPLQILRAPSLSTAGPGPKQEARIRPPERRRGLSAPSLAAGRRILAGHWWLSAWRLDKPDDALRMCTFHRPASYRRLMFQEVGSGGRDGRPGLLPHPAGHSAKAPTAPLPAHVFAIYCVEPTGCSRR
uniref:Protein kinase domain-containing protein n=1 Tax=Macrostomum lignano TaxID=282301 RepID=A0A1I8FJM1_9PLAT